AVLDKADEHRLASLDLAPTTEPAGRAQAFKLETRWRMLLGRVGLLLIVLAIWQFGAMLLQIPNFLLPKPTEIAGALARGLLEPPASSDSLYFNVGVTLLEAIAGFAIGSSAGLLLALLLASSPRLERLMLPYVLGFQSVPKVAIAPLI